MIKKILFALIIAIFIPVMAFADDWYIKDFNTQIIVNTDSTLNITERIVADCGNAVGKHGIFRVLPTNMNIDGNLVNIPVKLISITDFNGNPLKYSIIKDRSKNTITFKIGDPNRTVQGINYYQIVYSVKNAVRFYDFHDQLYWNLTGNFWELNIHSFSGEIIFPEGIGEDNTNAKIFIGSLGSQNLLPVFWDGKKLNIYHNSTLYSGDGISIMTDLEKGIFSPSGLSFLEKHPNILNLLWFLIPIVTFVICFVLWVKHGKDYDVDKAITPEFGPPEDLSPAEIGLIRNFGKINGAVITATIINLATKGILKIEEIKKSWILGGKDYKITIVDKEKLKDASIVEKTITDSIFSMGGSIHLSALKQNLRAEMQSLQKDITELMYSKGWLADNRRQTMMITILLFAIGGLYLLLSSLNIDSNLAIPSLFISGIFILFFRIFMPKRTRKGAELNWQIDGFKLYMETAEKYRQQFFEKENIFEKLLPYAIVFGIANLWTKKVGELYAQENKTFSYVPLWFVGSTSANFDLNGFMSSLNSISSSISSSTSSGAGGGGAGGGGGGGGGGGW
ncbi:MAG: DUF2207 domain-containing protein [Candidatus Pacebacteria bacterium]|nr:DUF2207 domain-containing protein [Candidatus Paceibacterota bacterium]